MKIKSLIKHNLMRAAMTLALVMTCAAAWAETVETYYIDENGTRHDVTATVVTTYMDYLGTDGETTWYVVNENVFLYDGSNNQTCLHGNVNLILADGCELKPACGSNGSEDGFRGSGNLTLYGQTAGTGTLSCGQEGFMNITGDFTVCSGMVSVSGYRCNAIRVANFTMRGGSISITNNTNNDCGIRATGTVNIYDGSVEAEGTNGIEADIVNIYGGSVTARCNGRNAPGSNYGHAIKCSSTFNFYGGNVMAQGDYNWHEGQTLYGIHAYSINLSWTSTDDWIYNTKDVNSDNVICYFVGSGGMNIAPYKPFTDCTTTYTGTLTDEQVEALADKTLQPVVPAFAETGDGTPEYPYTIYNATGWGQFCDALQDATYNHFSGKTVKLGADISITQSAGSAGHEFMGTFDGDGKTLTVDITETTTQGTAPFREIKGATIQNLVVTGSVDGTTHAAGLVGFARGADASTVNTITNCKVATNVTVTTPNSAGNYHCGGVVGHALQCTLNMSNTVYCGDITNSGNNYVGGLQGWSDGNTINFSHCLFVGSYSGTASFHPVAVRNRDKATTANVSHVYYTVTPTLTNSSFIAADGTKTISRATTPATIGDQTQSLNFMSTTLYQNGICYNNLYYATIGLPSGDTDIYLIDNADDWLYFCEMLNDNDTWNRFSGKTVKLGANIEVSRMAGADTHDFCGTFDGQNNTLTFTATDTDNYLAPFRNVSGTSETNHAVIQNMNVVTNITATDFRHAAGLIAAMYNHVDVANCNVTANITATKGTNNPNDLYPACLVSQVANGSQLTVSGCTVSGAISTDGKYAAGMVGIVQGSASITNSVSSVTINSSTNGDGTHGGFVASLVSGRQLTIEGCVFNGKIVTTNGTTNCGGFLGHNNTDGGTGATITNCLYAPTADPNTVSTGCATFGRNVNSDLISNCYYTTALGDAQDAQGTQAYSITAGDYVTTLANAGTVSNNYTTSGLIFYNVGLKYGDVLYAASNDEVSLTLSNSSGGDVPAGYQYVYSTNAGTLEGSTLTMPDADVIVSAALRSTGQPVSITYIDADGTIGSHDAIALDGTETMLGEYNEDTWYFVGIDINVNHQVKVYKVHLILCNGKSMNFGTSSSPVNFECIYYAYSNSAITIYGQTLIDDDAGNLNIYSYQRGFDLPNNYTQNSGNVTISSTYNYNYGISSSAVTLNGGKLIVTSISANNSSIYINGGKIQATSQLKANNNIKLGWTNPDDYIQVSQYNTRYGNVMVAAGKCFAYTASEETTILGGDNETTLTTDQIAAIAGKRLYPTVPYLDENGETQQCTEFTLLTGNETTLGTSGQETWYVADGTLNYGQTINLSGDVHLILKDNAVMNVGTEETPINGRGIDGSDHFIRIYGQSTGDHIGTLSVYTARYNCNGIRTNNLTINGGHVIANTNGGSSNALYAYNGGVVINGGIVEATATDAVEHAHAIYATYNFTYTGGIVEANAASGYAINAGWGQQYTFTWRNPSDRITIGSTGLYNNNYGDATATFTNAFTDGTNIYSGTLTGTEAISGLAGKTLYPNCVVMKQVEGYEEGNGGWVFIASPVAGSIAPSEVHNLIATTEEDFDLYYFDQTGGTNGMEWKNWKQGDLNDNPNFNLVNGQGYLYATKETRTLVFAGEYTAATGPVEVPLAYDENAEFAGWNLVGNPFAVGATLSQPYYRMNAEGTALKTETETTAVAAMEGVFVQATAANQTVTFTAQTRGGEQATIAQANIMVGGDNGAVIDNAIIRFDGGQTLEKFSFREGSTKIYIPQDGTDYAIVSVGRDGACTVSTDAIVSMGGDGACTVSTMPVNFKAETDGTYTISVNVDNVEMGYLHLIDNMTGADVDLLTPPAFGHPLSEGEAQSGAELGANSPATDSQTPAGFPLCKGGQGDSKSASYTFTAKTTDYESRFKLVFSADEAVCEPDEAFAFYSNGNWIINNPSTGSEPATLQVIDMNGRILSSERINGCVSKAIEAAAGVYVLRLINGDDVKIQKVVIE